MPNTTEKEKKERKKIIQRIMKERKRNHTFRYLMKYVGKGEKGNLKRLQIKVQQNSTIKIISNRNKIENKLLNYN